MLGCGGEGGAENGSVMPRLPPGRGIYVKLPMMTMSLGDDYELAEQVE